MEREMETLERNVICYSNSMLTKDFIPLTYLLMIMSINA